MAHWAGKLLVVLLFLSVLGALGFKTASEFYTGQQHREMVQAAKDLLIPMGVCFVLVFIGAFFWEE